MCAFVVACVLCCGFVCTVRVFFHHGSVFSSKAMCLLAYWTSTRNKHSPFPVDVACLTEVFGDPFLKLIRKPAGELQCHAPLRSPRRLQGEEFDHQVLVPRLCQQRCLLLQLWWHEERGRGLCVAERFRPSVFLQRQANHRRRRVHKEPMLSDAPVSQER